MPKLPPCSLSLYQLKTTATMMMRALYRSISLRSLSSVSAAAATHSRRHLTSGPRRFPFSFSPNRIPFECGSPFAKVIGGTRFFSDDMSHMPDIKDPQILAVFKDLMASSWDDIRDPVINDAKKALSKKSDDKAGQESLANVFRAAEACEEFGDILVSLRMEIDDSIGMSGENVKPLSKEFVNALRVAYERYTAYLDAFGPDEAYLRKKVETELGTKMIHLKMRCSGIGSEWGKVTVLGTSGLSGSYVEQRA